MLSESVRVNCLEQNYEIPLTKVHTLILGSGAAGLNAALQLHRSGVKDLLILTEGLSMGTSINTGSDKQTYYKLSMVAQDLDSPCDMASTYFANGSMHGDLALIEASLSARAFYNLVDLGVPFPRDRYGQVVGYKTDHDPRQRATSIGPYTSREMCRALIEQVKFLDIPVREHRNAIELLTCETDSGLRICGLLALDRNGDLESYQVENLIFAVGGPGGLYKSSVYPPVHSGAIGLALMAGADAANLTESQYGLASTSFRWNVSGSFMQVIPRFISRASDGLADEKEFLSPYFESPEVMNENIFLKGYQWPFDARKVINGSSLIDLLVYIETEIKGRRVFLDFTHNPEDFDLRKLTPEPFEYLQRSDALQDTPIERLQNMNPGAVELYLDHGIDIRKEPLEIAVCAQHNNGGLAGNIWWESTNIKHLFPIGEVNGSHGVTRPGGSALNAGQVAGFRAAEYIANRYQDWSLPQGITEEIIKNKAASTIEWMENCNSSSLDWRKERDVFQERMTRSGAHIRNKSEINSAVSAAWEQVSKILSQGCFVESKKQLKYAFRIRQLSYAHAVYLDAIKFVLHSGIGSRGSSIVLDPGGDYIHELLEDTWRIAEEDDAYRLNVLRSYFTSDGKLHHTWIPCRAIPKEDVWFESVWRSYREGEIYDQI